MVRAARSGDVALLNTIEEFIRQVGVRSQALFEIHGATATRLIGSHLPLIDITDTLRNAVKRG
jgi:hypothetical protein